jgi:hypothetical protein
MESGWNKHESNVNNVIISNLRSVNVTEGQCLTNGVSVPRSGTPELVRIKFIHIKNKEFHLYFPLTEIDIVQNF